MCANKDFPSPLRFLVFLWALTGTLSAAGQEDTTHSFKPAFSMGIQAFGGFIIPHSESIKSISYSSPFGVEASAAWHFSDIKAQSYCNCFPRMGISLSYINFDNPSILGESFTLAPFVEPYFTPGKKIGFSVRFAIGAAYLNNVYHPVNNPDNLFYSTRFSYILSLSPVFNYRVTPQWSLHAAANYNHISNGGNRQPNKGINFPTASMGITYVFMPVDFSRRVMNSNFVVNRKNRFRFILLGTAKTPSFETHKRKILVGLNIGYIRTIGRLSSLMAGAEFISDGALKAEIEQSNPSQPDHNRAALLTGHELRIGKFGFPNNWGFIFMPLQKPKTLFINAGDWIFISTTIFLSAQI